MCHEKTPQDISTRVEIVAICLVYLFTSLPLCQALINVSFCLE